MLSTQLIGRRYLAPKCSKSSSRQFTPSLSADSSLIDSSTAPFNWDPESVVVYPNVVSEAQANLLVEILNEKFKRCVGQLLLDSTRAHHGALTRVSYASQYFSGRRRYERGHWDSAIQMYREVELFEEEADVRAVLQPLRQLLEEKHAGGSALLGAISPPAGGWLPCHAIDLQETGALNAHVDSVRYSGNLVAGLSLLSHGIMRLKPSTSDDDSSGSTDSSKSIDLRLPPRSLYVLSGISRYEYTHELLPSGSSFRGNPVARGRRLSVILRSAKVDVMAD